MLFPASRIGATLTSMGPFGLVSSDQNRVARRIHDQACLRNPGRGVLDRLTRLLVDDLEHGFERQTQSLVERPAGDRFGDGIMKVMRPCVSVVTTPSPMLARVTRSNSTC